MAKTPSCCSSRRVKLALEALIARGAPLMMSSVYAWDYVYPLPNRSVSLAARSSDSGMHVDSCVWSITYVVLRCLCWRLLSRLTWAILLRLTWIPWLGHRGTVPWSVARAARSRLQRLEWSAVRAQIRPRRRDHGLVCAERRFGFVCEMRPAAVGARAGAVEAMHRAGTCRA